MIFLCPDSLICLFVCLFCTCQLDGICKHCQIDNDKYISKYTWFVFSGLLIQLVSRNCLLLAILQAFHDPNIKVWAQVCQVSSLLALDSALFSSLLAILQQLLYLVLEYSVYITLVRNVCTTMGGSLRLAPIRFV